MRQDFYFVQLESVTGTPGPQGIKDFEAKIFKVNAINRSQAILALAEHMGRMQRGVDYVEMHDVQGPLEVECITGGRR